MFDGVLIDRMQRRSEKTPALETLPWQLVALLLGVAILSVVAATLYPGVFGTPFEQF